MRELEDNCLQQINSLTFPLTGNGYDVRLALIYDENLNLILI